MIAIGERRASRAREGDSVVVQTDGGVGYAVTVPAGVAERLPAPGGRVSLHTELVVKEDGWSLYGFDRPVRAAGVPAAARRQRVRAQARARPAVRARARSGRCGASWRGTSPRSAR